MKKYLVTLTDSEQKLTVTFHVEGNDKYEAMSTALKRANNMYIAEFDTIEWHSL